MATPIYVPRINNNDDEVKVLAYEVAVGAAISAGQIIGQVETDKAALDVTAPCDGYVLGLVANPEDIVKVGSIMVWLGAAPDEPVPQDSEQSLPGGPDQARTVTAKAQLLLNESGLSIEDISPIGGRITAAAVQHYLAARRTSAKAATTLTDGTATAETMPDVPGNAVTLTREEKGMAATVAWHRDFPVVGYIELEYDLVPWVDYAKRFQEERRLMLSPLLSLMAWRLVERARTNPRLNATLVSGCRYEYAPINLGFTIQAGDSLYLAVIRDADRMDEDSFVSAMADIQRRATAHKLRESETTGATIGFSSMERWKVTRHIPVLPPRTALMIAHAAGRDGKGTLGATYDHRILNGSQVVAALRQLSKPGSA